MHSKTSAVFSLSAKILNKKEYSLILMQKSYRKSHFYSKKKYHMNISAHFSIFFTESSEIFLMLSTTCS